MDPETGFRGAVLIEAGDYEVASPLYITTSGVVIRGQGSQSSGGTTIITFTSTNRDSNLFTFGLASGGTDTISKSIVNVLDDFVPVGSMSLIVSNT
jgi:hypothetical protein